MSTTTPVVTGVDFMMIPIQDYDAAVAFYGETLGLPQVAEYGKARGAEFQAGNLTLQVMAVETVGMTFAPLPFPLALQVDDVHAAQAELESRGVEFAPQFIDSGVCHMAFFKDPAGNALMLHHRYAARSPAG
jgi:predicted enzyme related to lactoylglutathione lyase